VKYIIAGKNVHAFDIKFMNSIDFKMDEFSYPAHRHFDPAELYVDWENDDELPDLATCKQRAGIEGEVSHTALGDAWDVIQLLEHKRLSS